MKKIKYLELGCCDDLLSMPDKTVDDHIARHAWVVEKFGSLTGDRQIVLQRYHPNLSFIDSSVDLHGIQRLLDNGLKPTKDALVFLTDYHYRCAWWFGKKKKDWPCQYSTIVYRDYKKVKQLMPYVTLDEAGLLEIFSHRGDLELWKYIFIPFVEQEVTRSKQDRTQVASEWFARLVSLPIRDALVVEYLDDLEYPLDVNYILEGTPLFYLLRNEAEVLALQDRAGATGVAIDYITPPTSLSVWEEQTTDYAYITSRELGGFVVARQDYEFFVAKMTQIFAVHPERFNEAWARAHFDQYATLEPEKAHQALDEIIATTVAKKQIQALAGMLEYLVEKDMTDRLVKFFDGTNLWDFGKLFETSSTRLITKLVELCHPQNGNTLLHCSTIGTHIDSTKWRKKVAKLLTVPNNDGDTPLHVWHKKAVSEVELGAMYSRYEIRTAHLTLKNKVTGKTPLDYLSLQQLESLKSHCPVRLNPVVASALLQSTV